MVEDLTTATVPFWKWFLFRRQTLTSLLGAGAWWYFFPLKWLFLILVLRAGYKFPRDKWKKAQGKLARGSLILTTYAPNVLSEIKVRKQVEMGVVPASVAVPGASSTRSLAKTATGIVDGTIDIEGFKKKVIKVPIHSFLGIPYAAPPRGIPPACPPPAQAGVAGSSALHLVWVPGMASYGIIPPRTLSPSHPNMDEWVDERMSKWQQGFDCPLPPPSFPPPPQAPQLADTNLSQIVMPRMAQLQRLAAKFSGGPACCVVAAAVLTAVCLTWTPLCLPHHWSGGMPQGCSEDCLYLNVWTPSTVS